MSTTIAIMMMLYLGILKSYDVEPIGLERVLRGDDLALNPPTPAV